ncbi:MAG: hypothetical protein EZS28_022501 [Streblomastix strix]|uniref:Uncharacterized protein n=1 Tax=Streblomastix strix TaxID=222440 RepID=A0A5J4VHC2_9EUKA|nr:MAG: hypothetical protein EZS28_022501 [Streblomastix strix]
MDKMNYAYASSANEMQFDGKIVIIIIVIVVIVVVAIVIFVELYIEGIDVQLDQVVVMKKMKKKKMMMKKMMMKMQMMIIIIKLDFVIIIVVIAMVHEMQYEEFVEDEFEVQAKIYGVYCKLFIVGDYISRIAGVNAADAFEEMEVAGANATNALVEVVLISDVAVAYYYYEDDDVDVEL